MAKKSRSFVDFLKLQNIIYIQVETNEMKIAFFHCSLFNDFYLLFKEGGQRSESDHLAIFGNILSMASISI
jgi:hypothetical protein